MRHLKAVIFDWAGTLVDYGSLAPMGAFVETFAEFGVDLTVDEARGPMGMAKRPHIAAIMALPRIAEAWRTKHDALPTDKDIDAVYDIFVPKNIAVAARYATLVPGAAKIVQTLRDSGLKIGSCTGYTREIMAEILPVAAAQGLKVDCLACTGDTAQGRPSPLMLYKNMLDLDIWPAWTAVKVDDTEVGIAEGLNGGTWTVGVALSGNAFGLSLQETERLASEELSRRQAVAEHKLLSAGAHYVIGSVAELLPIMSEIEGRVARGERP